MEVPKPLKIWAGDIEQNALTVSKNNYFKLRARINSKTEVELVLSDRLQGTDCKYDFIVSNPPYIKFRADRPGVHEQADKFEPHTALFLDDQIFNEWFEELFKDTSAKLNVNGAFFMEGHEDSLLQLEQIAMKYFSKTEIKKDYTGRVRFLYAYK
jgi:release factor glutamine methyltransferase